MYLKVIIYSKDQNITITFANHYHYWWFMVYIFRSTGSWSSNLVFLLSNDLMGHIPPNFSGIISGCCDQVEWTFPHVKQVYDAVLLSLKLCFAFIFELLILLNWIEYRHCNVSTESCVPCVPHHFSLDSIKLQVWILKIWAWGTFWQVHHSLDHENLGSMFTMVVQD